MIRTNLEKDVAIKGNEKIGNNIIINETASSCCIDGRTQGPNCINMEPVKSSYSTKQIEQN
jgi:hypothetical protein